MYYLDLHKLYTPATKQQRIETRLRVRRDEVMAMKLRNQSFKCFYCGIAIDMSGHLDHVIPIYYGGDNRLRNLVAACRPCNLTKMTDQIEITNPRTINDYLQLQRTYERLHGRRYAHKSKRYQLYKVLRADLFREV